ncbi:hypothetical protein DPMN_054789 [Dreissena polymorpha]|uniref:Secreted protein n=1 Tax=Dreissena polymorpha TaxID=45954 RepID=A0A9D4CQI8_DREPO|nr:hypothetical protein DPMN_054789 [Dreissena polymorpha]
MSNCHKRCDIFICAVSLSAALRCDIVISAVYCHSDYDSANYNYNSADDNIRVLMVNNTARMTITQR